MRVSAATVFHLLNGYLDLCTNSLALEKETMFEAVMEEDEPSCLTLNLLMPGLVFCWQMLLNVFPRSTGRLILSNSVTELMDSALAAVRRAMGKQTIYSLGAFFLKFIP